MKSNLKSILTGCFLLANLIIFGQPYTYVPDMSVNPSVLNQIDQQTNTIVNTINLSLSFPNDLVITPDGNSLYIIDYNAAAVDVVDLNTFTLSTTITTGLSSGGFGIDVSPDGSTVITANQSGNIHFISTATNTVVNTISTAGSTSCVGVSPDGNTAYATSQNGDLYQIDMNTQTLLNTYNTGTSALGLRISADGSNVYIAGHNSVGPVYFVFDTVTNTFLPTTATTGIIVRTVAINADESLLYVADNTNDDLLVFDLATNNIVSTFNSSLNLPYGIGFSPDYSTIYLTDAGATSLEVIDAASLTLTTTILNAGTAYVKNPTFSNGNAALPPVAGVPTLSQWGLIVLSLTLLIFGVVVMRQDYTRKIELN